MADDFRYSDRQSARGERAVARRQPDDDDFDDRPRFRRGLSDLFHPTEDEKNSAMLCHLLAIFLHFIGPIIIWASKKEESKFVDWHGREALNFSINMMIYNVVGGLVITAIAIVTCGFGAILIPLLFLVPIYALIMHIIALNAAKRGELYRYPMIFRVIGPPEGTESIADQYSMPMAAQVPVSTPANGYSTASAPQYYEPPPASSGSGMIWVWIVGALCLLLLLGCFGAIGVFFLIRGSSPKPLTSKSRPAMTSDVDPNLGQQFPPAGPIGKQDQPGNQKPVPPNLPPVGRPNLPDNPPKKIDPVEQALDDMKSKDLFVRGRAADALAGMQPVHPKRAEVAKAIEKLLQDPETYPRQAAARALPVWATKENLPAMIDLLADSFSDKSKIINRLAEFKDERAIKPLADALKNPSTRKTAADALKGFGPKAEDDVIPLLQDRRFAIKQSACDVLKVIGTKKSIAPLQALTNERSRLVAKAAQEALDAVKARNP